MSSFRRRASVAAALCLIAASSWAKPAVIESGAIEGVQQGDLTLYAGVPFAAPPVEAVRGAIRTHMYERDPAGPEAIYLHDADALDWLGAIGVARVFGLVDPDGGSPDGQTTAKQLAETLTEVPPRIVSRADQARAAQRFRELKDFLRALRAESADLRSL